MLFAGFMNRSSKRPALVRRTRRSSAYLSIGTVPAESSTNWTLQRPYSEQFVHAGDLPDPNDRHLAEAGKPARLIDPDYPGDIKACDDGHHAVVLARHLSGC